LAANVKIISRLAELRAEAAGDTIATEKERRERLTTILRKSESEANAIRSAAELNKMDGSYAPEKHTVAMQGDVTFIIGRGYEEK